MPPMALAGSDPGLRHDPALDGPRLAGNRRSGPLGTARGNSSADGALHDGRLLEHPAAVALHGLPPLPAKHGAGPFGHDRAFERERGEHRGQLGLHSRPSGAACPRLHRRGVGDVRLAVLHDPLPRRSDPAARPPPAYGIAANPLAVGVGADSPALEPGDSGGLADHAGGRRLRHGNRPGRHARPERPGGASDRAEPQRRGVHGPPGHLDGRCRAGRSGPGTRRRLGRVRLGLDGPVARRGASCPARHRSS